MNNTGQNTIDTLNAELPPVLPTIVARDRVDFDRLDALIGWAEKEYEKSLEGKPSEWDQGNWVIPNEELGCGTACCIAGKVAFDDGVLKPLYTYDSGLTIFESTYVNANVVGLPVEQDPHDPSARLWNYARAVLGLPTGYGTYLNRDDEYGSVDLFGSSNKIGDLKRIRDEYAAFDGEPTKYTDEEYREGKEDDDEYGEYEDDLCDCEDCAADRTADEEEYSTW